MDGSNLVSQLYIILYEAAILAGPPLLVATIFGFIVSLLQAITQIQDQSLPQTVKIVSIGLTLLFFGAALTGPLFENAKRIFQNFPDMIN